MAKSNVTAKLPLFRTAYDGLDNIVSIATAAYNVDENGDYDVGCTVQADASAHDINNIISRYEITRLHELRADHDRANYIDLSKAPDYKQALDIIADANEAFEGLPAHIRERFYNDPARFLEFVHNKDNLEEMYKLGLATRPEPKAAPEPVAVRLVDPATPPAPAGSKPA